MRIYTTIRSISLFLLLSAFSSGLRAQVPGYLGKRFVVSAEANCSPSPSGMWNSHKANTSLLNFRPGASVEYVLLRNQSIEASFHTFRTFLPLKEAIYFGQSGGYINSHEFYRYARLRAFDIGLAYRVYTSGLPAPLGDFISFSVFYIQSKPEYSLSLLQWEVDVDFKDNTHLLPKLPSNTIDPHRSFGIKYEIGKQRILFNTLTIKYSYGISFAFPQKFDYIKQEFRSDYETYETLFNQEYIHKNISTRLFYSYFLNFKLGIGLVM